jgi:hypothetical protein
MDCRTIVEAAIGDFRAATNGILEVRVCLALLLIKRTALVAHLEHQCQMEIKARS